MNYSLFNEQMTGNWIVQSTNYSSKKNSDFIEILTNKVKYTNLINTDFYLKLLSNDLNINYLNKKIEIYCIEFQAKNNEINKQYLLVLNDNNNQTIFLKFNDKFEYLNKFKVQIASKKYLSIVSENKNMKIIEKIYFLNSNLKVIKTIIKKHEKDIAISFSSEIRIS